MQNCHFFNKTLTIFSVTLQVSTNKKCRPAKGLSLRPLVYNVQLLAMAMPDLYS